MFRLLFSSAYYHNNQTTLRAIQSVNATEMTGSLHKMLEHTVHVQRASTACSYTRLEL